MYVSCQHCSKAATRNFSQQSKPQQKLSFMWHFVMILLMFSLCTTMWSNSFWSHIWFCFCNFEFTRFPTYEISCEIAKAIKRSMRFLKDFSPILSCLCYHTYSPQEILFFMILPCFQMHYDDNLKCLSII